MSRSVWSGRRLRAHRQRAGLSQFQLAIAAGCRPAKLSVYELNKTTPELATAARLAQALGIKVDDLLEPAEAQQ